MNYRCTSDTALGKRRGVHQPLEQKCISDSVRVDKDPVAHLRDEHNGGDSNLGSVVSSFRSQVRNPEFVKERSNLVLYGFIQEEIHLSLDRSFPGYTVPSHE